MRNCFSAPWRGDSAPEIVGETTGEPYDLRCKIIEELVDGVAEAVSFVRENTGDPYDLRCTIIETLDDGVVVCVSVTLAGV